MTVWWLVFVRCIRVGIFLLAATLSLTAGAAERLDIRVGVLKYGTVNWELDTLSHHGLDAAAGFRLVVVPYASPRAMQVALLGNAVDVIVGDWIWVSRQRDDGADFTFIPYSTSVGAVMTPAASPIQALSDIGGQKIGVAGGPLDKSWLVAKAYLAANGHGGVAEQAALTFGAPPLLSQLLLRGEIDAVFTYWHYAARLQAAGMRRVVGIGELARSLGIDAGVPLLGYIFRDGWAAAHRQQVLGFAKASRAAKEILGSRPGEWRRLRPLLRAEDEETARLLRDGYVAGAPKHWGAAERAGAGKLYGILAKSGGRAFSDGQTRLAPGTFWADLIF